MKLVFCGTPMFAVPCLEGLITAGHEVMLVVTQPDRPQGRGMTMAAPPVKQAALKLGLPVIQPEKIKKNLEFQEQLTRLKPERNHRCRLRTHHTALDAATPSSWQHQCPWVVAAKISGGSADSVGDCQW